MAVIASAELIADPERIARTSPARSAQMLRPVAELFGVKADRPTAEAR